MVMKTVMGSGDIYLLIIFKGLTVYPVEPVLCFYAPL